MTRDECINAQIVQIKDTLRGEKMARRMTRQKLADISGVAVTSVYNVLNGESSCSNLRTMMLVADVLGYEFTLRRKAAELPPDEAVMSQWSSDWGKM